MDTTNSTTEESDVDSDFDFELGDTEEYPRIDLFEETCIDGHTTCNDNSENPTESVEEQEKKIVLEDAEFRNFFDGWCDSSAKSILESLVIATASVLHLYVYNSKMKTFVLKTPHKIVCDESLQSRVFQVVAQFMAILIKGEFKVIGVFNNTWSELPPKLQQLFMCVVCPSLTFKPTKETWRLARTEAQAFFARNLSPNHVINFTDVKDKAKFDLEVLHKEILQKLGIEDVEITQPDRITMIRSALLFMNPFPLSILYLLVEDVNLTRAIDLTRQFYFDGDIRLKTVLQQWDSVKSSPKIQDIKECLITICAIYSQRINCTISCYSFEEKTILEEDRENAKIAFCWGCISPKTFPDIKSVPPSIKIIFDGIFFRCLCSRCGYQPVVVSLMFKNRLDMGLSISQPDKHSMRPCKQKRCCFITSQLSGDCGRCPMNEVYRIKRKYHSYGSADFSREEKVEPLIHPKQFTKKQSRILQKAKKMFKQPKVQRKVSLRNET